jgi:hypothetical protein
MEKVLITAAVLLRMEAAARREELLELGLRLVPKNQVHRSKKEWRRRPKHRRRDEE